MRQRVLWIPILVAIAFSGVVSWSSQAHTAIRPTWEYKVISIHGPSSMHVAPNVHKLNEAGDDGWELVGVRAGDYSNAPQHVRTDYYFKREK